MKQNSLWPDVSPGPGFIECWARTNGCAPVLGVDEVGRGCLAGPVVAAAILLPDDFPSIGIDDSKRLSPSRRRELDKEIRLGALAIGLGLVEAAGIDETGILPATFMAMRHAVLEALTGKPSFSGIVLVDGTQTIPGLSLRQRAWPKGDHLSLNCAAASIVAKVFRDSLMERLDEIHPQYGFADHKGYGTRVHMEAIRIHGPCPLHRMSFAPLKMRPR